MEKPWTPASRDDEPLRGAGDEPREGARAEPPAAHQRRFLVNGRAAPSVAFLTGDAAGWQQAHLGAVFVSVGAGSPGGADLVERFLAAGCTGRLVSFYQPDLVEGLAELARLVEETWSWRSPGPGPWPGGDRAAAPLEVAEILAVGATETIGFAAAATELAAVTATRVNEVLERRELPSPKAFQAVPARRGPVPPSGSDPGAGTATSLLREGTRIVSLECEQRLEVFQDLGAAARPPDGWSRPVPRTL